MTVIVKFFGEVDFLLHNYLFNVYNSLAQNLRHPIGLVVIIYITLLGFAISFGWIKLSISTLTKIVIKIGIVYTLALNWGFFSEYVVTLISGGANQLSAALMHSTQLSLPHVVGSGVNGALQTVLIEFTKIGTWIWHSGSWNNFAPYFTAMITWGFGYSLVLVVCFQLLIAKIMLAVLLSLAPLFVVFVLFQSTYGFFNRWLGALVGYALLPILVSAVLALSLDMSQWSIAGVYASKALNVSLVTFVPIMVVSFISIGLVQHVARLSHNIGGMITVFSSRANLATGLRGAVTGLVLPVGAMSGIGALNGAATARAVAKRTQKLMSIGENDDNE